MIYKLLRHVTLEAGSYSSQNPPIFHLIPRNALICKLKPITLYWFLRQYFIDKSLAIFYISLGSVFFSIPYGITSRQPNTQNSNERKWELIILFLEECRSILLLLLLFFFPFVQPRNYVQYRLSQYTIYLDGRLNICLANDHLMSGKFSKFLLNMRTFFFNFFNSFDQDKYFVQKSWIIFHKILECKKN